MSYNSPIGNGRSRFKMQRQRRKNEEKIPNNKFKVEKNKNLKMQKMT